MSDQLPPFAAFRSERVHQNAFRAAMMAAYRRPEPECLPMLLDLATLAPEESARAASIARDLAAKLRVKTRSSHLEGLIHEYSLSSQEGVEYQSRVSRDGRGGEDRIRFTSRLLFSFETRWAWSNG